MLFSNTLTYYYIFSTLDFLVYKNTTCDANSRSRKLLDTNLLPLHRLIPEISELMSAHHHTQTYKLSLILKQLIALNINLMRRLPSTATFHSPNAIITSFFPEQDFSLFSSLCSTL